MTTIDRELTLEKEPTPKSALLFPGQGTQEVGMGQKLYARYGLAHQVYDEADKILGYPISQISFEGPDTLLNQTVHTQPAIFVYSHACFKIIQEQHKPQSSSISFVAGHSLGEYNALVAAGALSFPNALRLVQKRAECMQRACQANPGGLIAVVNPLPEQVDFLKEERGLEIALINTHDQIVFGGKLDDLDEAEIWLKTNKVRATRLKVAGAFHTSLMEPAVAEFSEAVDQMEISDATIPIIANTTALTIRTREEIRPELPNQLTHPVLWQQTVTSLVQQGTERTFEVGEKGMLTNMNQKIVGGVVAGTILTLTGITVANLWHKHLQQ